jgi:uncharacterized protein YprB with RNaseH-like and TPR domain
MMFHRNIKRHQDTQHIPEDAKKCPNCKFYSVNVVEYADHVIACEKQFESVRVGDQIVGKWKIDVPMIFPPMDKSIFLDIETEPYGTRIWLIGVRLADQMKQFYAPSYRSERKILREFVEYLEQYPGYPLICYSTSNFDFVRLIRAASNFRMKDLIYQLESRSLIDLGTILKRCFLPRNKMLGLKPLTSSLGYAVTHADYDGLKVAEEYEYSSNRNNVDWVRLAKEYNQDDVDSMYHLIATFRERITFEPRYIRKEAVDKINNRVFELVSDYTISSESDHKEYIRVQCDPEKVEELWYCLSTLGMPIHSAINHNAGSITWRSNGAWVRIRKILGEEE